MGAQTSGSRGSGEKWSDSGYSLKLEPIGLPDRSDVGYEERSQGGLHGFLFCLSICFKIIVY